MHKGESEDSFLGIINQLFIIFQINHVNLSFFALKCSFSYLITWVLIFNLSVGSSFLSGTNWERSIYVYTLPWVEWLVGALLCDEFGKREM